jgi:hypothetical protein
MGQSKTNMIKPNLNKIILDKSKKELSCGVAAMKGIHKHKCRVEKFHGRHSCRNPKLQLKS